MLSSSSLEVSYEGSVSGATSYGLEASGARSVGHHSWVWITALPRMDARRSENIGTLLMTEERLAKALTVCQRWVWRRRLWNAQPTSRGDAAKPLFVVSRR